MRDHLARRQLSGSVWFSQSLSGRPLGNVVNLWEWLTPFKTVCETSWHHRRLSWRV
ncbi:hypothetical protein DPMN_191566 [Dreissena polymorpha]|uniref:Uncharacterized protein n=1 Tax=Dreissena polymorpha TaxID=45954 RepID=A0A9D3Y4N0_DREPO|nr:hypothetical protein DPMN_191566 [Dreissena polymorpha]